MFSIVWRGIVIPLPAGTHIVGRDSTADVRIDSSGVSRRHALIDVSPAGVTIEDLGSKNGTYVGNVRISDRVAIHSATEIRLGSALLRILESS